MSGWGGRFVLGRRKTGPPRKKRCSAHPHHCKKGRTEQFVRQSEGGHSPHDCGRRNLHRRDEQQGRKRPCSTVDPRLGEAGTQPLARTAWQTVIKVHGKAEEMQENAQDIERATPLFCFPNPKRRNPLDPCLS